MRLLFLDTARKCGFAYGDAGTVPASGSIALREPGAQNALALGALGRWLRDHVRTHGKPDLIGVEHWMAPGAQPSGKAVEDALRLNGAVHAIAGVYGIPVTEPYPSTIRSQVCGKVSVPGQSKRGGKTLSNTKWLVIDTVALRGLLPKDSTDDNRADAVAGWVFLEANFSRVPPARFVLT